MGDAAPIADLPEGPPDAPVFPADGLQARVAQINAIPLSGRLNIPTAKLERRLTIHDVWLQDHRPGLVAESESHQPVPSSAAPLRNHGIHVHIRPDDTSLRDLLPLVAGYVNLSDVNQLGFLWRAFLRPFDAYYEAKK
ncbi:hypothetical protein M409DRAFT_31191, partial [Zasmidium cellare ATCC 36951]